MTPLEPIGLAAAFVVGAAGSAHCFGMCGGIAGALKLRASSLHPGGRTATIHALVPQIGRVATYSLMGALVGAFGGGLQSLLDLTKLDAMLRTLSGVLLLIIAARLLLRWNGLTPLERFGGYVWKVFQPLTKRISPGGTLSSLLIGMSWGLLPCAMVYSALAFAALSASAWTGAALMAAFGAGTMPALFAGSFLFSSRSGESDAARRLSGTLLVAFGCWMIAGPWVMGLLGSDHATHMSHIQ